MNLLFIISDDYCCVLDLFITIQYPSVPCHGHKKEEEQNLLCGNLSTQMDGDGIQFGMAIFDSAILGRDGRALLQSRVYSVV